MCEALTTGGNVNPITIQFVLGGVLLGVAVALWALRRARADQLAPLVLMAMGGIAGSLPAYSNAVQLALFGSAVALLLMNYRRRNTAPGPNL
jgi:hypothetical protein